MASWPLLPGGADQALAKASCLDVDQVPAGVTALTPEAINRFRDVMQSELMKYRRSFTDLGSAARTAVLRPNSRYQG